VYLSSQIVE